MANTSSAKKAVRKMARKTEVNRARRSFVRGIYHKNTASRKISRLNKRVKALG